MKIYRVGDWNDNKDDINFGRIAAYLRDEELDQEMKTKALKIMIVDINIQKIPWDELTDTNPILKRKRGKDKWKWVWDNIIWHPEEYRGKDVEYDTHFQLLKEVTDDSDNEGITIRVDINKILRKWKWDYKIIGEYRRLQMDFVDLNFCNRWNYDRKENWRRQIMSEILKEDNRIIYEILQEKDLFEDIQE